MLETGIDIQGLKAMEKALVEIGKEVGAKKATGMMTSALRDGAKEFEDTMRKDAPESEFNRIVKTKSGSKVEIRPGFLKSRIKVRASTNRKANVTRKFGKNVVSLVQAGVFKVPYIVQVEYGTSRTKQKPFIRNSFRKKKQASVTVINRRLARKIKLAQNRIAKKYQSK